jgi:hypothetical protein
MWRHDLYQVLPSDGVYCECCPAISALEVVLYIIGHKATHFLNGNKLTIFCSPRPENGRMNNLQVLLCYDTCTFATVQDSRNPLEDLWGKLILNRSSL